MQNRKMIIMLIFLPMVLFGDPWGKDAELAYKQVEKPAKKEGIGVKFSEILIAFHQNVISPADGPRSNYYPSSSQYMLDAIHKYGFLQGYVMGCDRLMRENDEAWVYKQVPGRYGDSTKYDPVP